jgi:hypothetical protein
MNTDATRSARQHRPRLQPPQARGGLLGPDREDDPGGEPQDPGRDPHPIAERQRNSVAAVGAMKQVRNRVSNMVGARSAWMLCRPRMDLTVAFGRRR